MSLLLATSLSSCTKVDSIAVDAPSLVSYAGAVVQEADLKLPAKVQGESVSLGFGDHYEARFWPGVNLGATVPGTSPGEVSGTRDQYDRWLDQMGELGVRTVRIYTILRPEFYDALAAHNEAHPMSPIYVIHGVWIPEEEFISTQNAYDPAVVNGFREELADAVSVVHGDADLPERPGHASGKYETDISQWLLAWSIGVEWDPFAVQSTDQKNAGKEPFSGKWFTASPDATPMESWIASNLDYVAGLEAGHGWSRPLTFTNWITADPLKHPQEPLEQEDLVSVDATHIAATSAWPGGFFVSYHVYPYYPDFLRLDPTYAKYKKADGTIDPYAGYLHALRAHHRGQAIMVTEFGVPSSLGVAHSGPLGRDQGAHSETEAAQINADLMRDIKSEGFSGAVLFEWLDEWFKFTWNTIDYELPSDRRQLWRNVLTNEEHFGVIATEPGDEMVVTVDGDGSEWNKDNSKLVESSDTGPVREVRMAHDAENVYLRITTAEPNGWQGTTLAFDSRPGNNKGVEDRPGVSPEADVQVSIDADNRVVLKQAAWTDPVAWQFGVAKPYVAVNMADLQQGSGKWVLPRQILNRPQLIMGTDTVVPAELRDIDHLPWGTRDPKSPNFDVRNLAYGQGTTLELAVPWALLTFADPSSKQVYVPKATGEIDHETVDALRLDVVEPDGQVLTAKPYEWDNWNTVKWHERRKAGWDVLHQSYVQTADPPPPSAVASAAH